MKLLTSLTEAPHTVLSSASHLRTYGRWFRLGLLLSIVAIILNLFLLIAIHARPTRLLPIPKIAVEDSIPPLSINITERIYIASLAWNNEEILRQYWIPALLDLVSHCEKRNIYVSILESGSWDGTKDALRLLDIELEKLGVERSVVLSDRTHEDEITPVPAEVEKGWIWSTSGNIEMRRLPFLASTRNAAMENLRELAMRGDAEGGPRTFDKVLWLNGDVIFKTEQVSALLATRKGDYAAACALDFSDPPLFYDSFAVRDIEGNAALSKTYPYFLAPDSLDAVYSNSPIPVQSCWNSLTIFDAKPFYNNPPLSFRAIPDSLAAKHIEGSECCLIHVDNPLSASKGVWLNPTVRVTYNNVSDAIVNPKGGGTWPTAGVKLKGVWTYRWIRWSQWLSRWLRDRRVSTRFQQWKNGPRKEGEDEHVEPGHVCLVDEMQVLLSNGWKHVR